MVPVDGSMLSPDGDIAGALLIEKGSEDWDRMFDLADAAGVMLELKSCRSTFPQHYIRLVAFDSTRGVETIAMSFIVNRPAVEPGFGLVRQETNGRTMRYTIRGYEAERAEGERYRK